MLHSTISRKSLAGVYRNRNKKLVLSYVGADEPFDVAKDAIYDYAKNRDVTITNVRLMKHWEGRRNPTFPILDDDCFWPENVNCREWPPNNVWYNDDKAEH